MPVGAPDTQFFYDWIKAGQSLEVVVKPETFKQADIYLTLYDRSSLPLASSKIEVEKHTSKPIPSNGYYLMRVRQKNISTDLSLVQGIEINKI